jgi:hypothetical protein
MPATLEAPAPVTTISPRTGQKRSTPMPEQPAAPAAEAVAPAPKTPKAKKSRSPEVTAVATPLLKAVDKAFVALGPMTADTVHLHRELRVCINSHIHAVYVSEKAFTPAKEA